MEQNKTIPVMLFLCMALAILSITSVSALEIVSPTSFSVNQSVMKFYNITVNNSAAGSANITTINITLPAGFRYIATSAGTTQGANFSNLTRADGGQNLIWENSTGFPIIYNNTNGSFWFNATANATTLGTLHFNFSIKNDTSALVGWTDIVVTVNDTIAPSITVTSPVAQTYTGTNNFTVSMITTITDNSGATTNWYVFNGGANTTFTGTQLLTAVQGSNTLVVWANDSTGNIASQTVTFTMPGISIVGANAACSAFANGVGNLGYGILTLLGIAGVILVFAAIVVLVFVVQGQQVFGMDAMPLITGLVIGIGIIVITIFSVLIAMQGICPGV